jgi:hypothetical protein
VYGDCARNQKNSHAGIQQDFWRLIMTDGSIADRSFRRVKADIPCTVQILAPEETFSPYQFEGSILDISQAGIGLAVPEMPLSVYTLLLRGKQYTRITADLPGSDGDTRIFGRVVWLDYRDGEDRPLCRLGIAVEQNTPQVLDQFKRAVEILASQSGQTSPAKCHNLDFLVGEETAQHKAIRP